MALGDNLESPFGQMAPEHPAGKNRFPKNYDFFTVDLFANPVIQQALSSLREKKDADLKAACSGPTGNIDLFINQNAFTADLVYEEALTAFGLDCRLTAGQEIAFLGVVDELGNVQNIVQLPHRAQSMAMYNSTTVLASTTSGTYLWNYARGLLNKLAIEAGPAAMAFRSLENKFYGQCPKSGHGASAEAELQEEVFDEADEDADDMNSICSFDGTTGKTLFTGDPEGFYWQDNDAKFNYISFNGDSLYVSEGRKSALKKVDMKTGEVEWNMGGPNNDFTVFDFEGDVIMQAGQAAPDAEDDSFGMAAKTNMQAWSHLSRFQSVDGKYFTLFDNQVAGSKKASMVDDTVHSSRMIVLFVDEENRVAREIYSHNVGDASSFYGGCDILPSGNVLGSSYPEWVYPDTLDMQYQQNIWEVNPNGRVAWRVAIKGLNPMAPSDVASPYPKYLNNMNGNNEHIPIGWNIMSVERFYNKPIFTQPCSLVVNDRNYVMVTPFNSVRTQEDTPGVIMLASIAADPVALVRQEFMFQKSWLPRPISMEVPSDRVDDPLYVTLMNHWGEATGVDIDPFSTLQECQNRDNNRVFWPQS